MEKEKQAIDKKEEKYCSVVEIEKTLMPNLYEQKINEFNLNNKINLVDNIFSQEMLKGIKI
jgi:uncharacterized OsmC-like protein